MTGSGGQLLPDLLLCAASLVALVTTVLVLCRKKKSGPPAGPRTPFGLSEDPRTPSLIEFDKFHPYCRDTRDLSATKVEKVEDKKLVPIGNDQFLNAKGEVVRAACDDETILDIKGDFGKVQAVGMKEATVSGAQLEQRPQHAPDEIECPAIIPEKVEKLDEKSFRNDQDEEDESEERYWEQHKKQAMYDRARARDKRCNGHKEGEYRYKNGLVTGKCRGSKSRGSKRGHKPSRKSRQENMKKRSKKYDDDDRERDEDRRDRDDDMRRRKRDDKDNDDRRSDYDKKKDRDDKEPKSDVNGNDKPKKEEKKEEKKDEKKEEKKDEKKEEKREEKKDEKKKDKPDEKKEVKNGEKKDEKNGDGFPLVEPTQSDKSTKP